jgi:pimeloyl-ACP methyl ester carboxylesterase
LRPVRRGHDSRRGAAWLAAALFALPLALAGASVSVAAVPIGALSTAAVQKLLVARATSGREQAIRLPARSKTAGTPCGNTPGLQCSELAVPLDRTGATPGTISLHVEYLPPPGAQRGVVFLIAGGPGQGSAHVFGLGTPAAASLFQFLFPGYGLVAYDDRGTGASGLIDCPALQQAITADQQRASAAQCADIIGPGRTFYSTGDHAEDLEAVRASLGVDKVALYGVSYGTKLALAYALAHPGHVERLLLDSVVPPDLAEPFGGNVLRALPATLNGFCSDGGCRSATSDLGSDVAAVANALAAKPLQGKVLLPSGATAPERFDALAFLSMVLDADLNPGLAAELPAVVHAARLGNTQPLLRLGRLHDESSVLTSEDHSFGLYAATVCRDGPFPWSPDTPIPDRQALYQAAVAALPPGSLGPFGTWSSRFGNADFCLDWPSPSGGGTLGPGPLPNVPLLAMSGGFDMRTPTASAQAIVARFPQGRLLVVPGIGHSVTTADPSACAARAVRTWMTGGTVPAVCPRPKPIVSPVPALPAPGVAHPKKPASPAQTYTIASATLREAEAMWLTAAPRTVAGVFGGKIAAGARSFTLTRYSIARGVTLTGTLKLSKTTLPLVFQGAVTVAGPGASPGLLGLSGTSLRGTLGGRLVGR